MTVLGILIGLLAGVGLAAFAAFAYFLVKWVQNLTKAMTETNRLLRQLVESSDLTAGMKAFSEISETGRGMMKMMATLNATITMFYQMAVTGNGIPGVAAPVSDNDSSFVPYDETKAGEREFQSQMRQRGIPLVEERQPTSEGAVGAQV